MESTELSNFVKNQVYEQVKETQTRLLTKLDELITAKLSSFNQQINENQRILSDVQVAKIEQINNDKFKFTKKGNEEQFKANAKVEQKLKEADALLKEDTEVRRVTTKAQDKIETETETETETDKACRQLRIRLENGCGIRGKHHSGRFRRREKNLESGVKSSTKDETGKKSSPL